MSKLILGSLSVFLLLSSLNAATTATETRLDQLKAAGFPIAEKDYLTPEETTKWATTFYKTKDFSKVPKALLGFRHAQSFERSSGQGITAGFIAGIIQQDPKDAERWLKYFIPETKKEALVLNAAIFYSAADNYQELFDIINNNPKSDPSGKAFEDLLQDDSVEQDLTKLKPSRGYVIDLWQGAYFATGDPRYIELIIQSLPGGDLSKEKRLGENKIGTKALWNLSEICTIDLPAYTIVKKTLESSDKKSFKVHLNSIAKASHYYQRNPADLNHRKFSGSSKEELEILRKDMQSVYGDDYSREAVDSRKDFKLEK